MGRWSHAWRRPSPGLRELVGGYTGYRQRLAVEATHRGVPTATLPLVISFGPATTVTLPGSGRRPATFGSFLAGLHDRYVLIDAAEHHGIQVDLRPLAAHRLLGRPLGELTTQVVGLAEVFGADAERLVDDLATAPDWATRFARLDRELHRRLVAGDRRPDAEVAHAFHLIRTSRGRVRVAELARATGWSERRLSGRFAHSVGLPPKRLARLTRFEHAMGLLAAPRRPELAQLAATTGYYDQAHLANDIKSYTGLSPTQLLARRLPDAGGVFDLDAA